MIKYIACMWCKREVAFRADKRGRPPRFCTEDCYEEHIKFLGRPTSYPSETTTHKVAVPEVFRKFIDENLEV